MNKQSTGLRVNRDKPQGQLRRSLAHAEWAAEGVRGIRLAGLCSMVTRRERTFLVRCEGVHL